MAKSKHDQIAERLSRYLAVADKIIDDALKATRRRGIDVIGRKGRIVKKARRR